jgi:hypothetical protein
MQYSHSRWQPLTRLRLAIIVTSALFAGVACDGDDDGGTSVSSAVNTSGGGSGGTGGSSGSSTQSSTNANSNTSGGGAPECNVRPLSFACYEDLDDEQCYTLAELNDPCTGTHLLSVHQGQAGASGAGGAGDGVMGDGGTEDCPSAEELFWGDVGERCGCFDTPACETPTVQRGTQCCYRVQRSCRLC